MFLFFLFLYFTFSNACNMVTISDCDGFNQLEESFSVIFTPEDQIDQKCRELERTLKCAYTDENLQGCTNNDRAPLDSQRRVVLAMCEKQYRKYLDCTSRAQDRFKIQCADYGFFKDNCRTLQQHIDCSKEVGSAVCDAEHGEFMELMSYEFNHPWARLLDNCNLKPPAIIFRTTTTSSSSTTTTATVMKMTTPKVMANKSKTTNSITPLKDLKSTHHSSSTMSTVSTTPSSSWKNCPPLVVLMSSLMFSLNIHHF